MSRAFRGRNGSSRYARRADLAVVIESFDQVGGPPGSRVRRWWTAVVSGVNRSPRWASIIARLVVDSFPLPGGLWLALATSLLCGVYLSPAAHGFSAGIGLLLAVAVVSPWLLLRGLRCQLHFATARAMERGPLRIVLEVDNRWPFRVQGVELHAFDLGSGIREDGGCALAPMAARHLHRLAITRTAERRGLYPRTPWSIASAHPLGIHRFQRSVPHLGGVTIHPLVFALPEELRQLGPVSGPVQAVSTPLRGVGDEWTGIRAYRDGEPIRHVHWPLSARQEQLIVVQHVVARSPEAQLILDTQGVPCDADPWNCAREWSLRVAASLCRNLLDRGCRVRFVAGSHTLYVHPEGRSWQTVMDLLAKLDLAAPGKPIEAGPANIWTCIVSTNLESLRLAPQAETAILIAGANAFPSRSQPGLICLEVDELRSQLEFPGAFRA